MLGLDEVREGLRGEGGLDGGRELRSGAIVAVLAGGIGQTGLGGGDRVCQSTAA